jgi:hypothetical protein
MPTGQYSLADVEQAPPMGKFSMADVQTDATATAKPPSFWDTLQREGKALTGTIAGMPAAVYHAFSEPATAEEKAKFGGEDQVTGAKRVGLGLHRLTTAPVETAIDWYSDAAKGKIPNAYDQMLSVAPEAMGSAAGSVVAGKLAEAAPGAVRTIASEAPGAVAATGDALSAIANHPLTKAVGKTVSAIANHPLTKALGKTVDIATFERLSKLWDAWIKTLPEELRGRAGEQKPVYPGASLPANPLPEQLNPSLVSPARTLPGMNAPEVIRPPAQPIPARPGLLLSGETAPEAATTAQPAPAPAAEETPATRSFNLEAPQTLSGESALRKILTGQDSANLLKIAKSRGIDVATESQLRPGIAGPRLINKIVDDFAADELQEVRDQYIENTRFRHSFGNIGPEAWKTMSLQTYFPDLKIPEAVLKRTQTAIARGNTPDAIPPELSQKLSNLQEIIQSSANKGKSPSAPAAAAAPAEDLTDILQQSVAKARKARKLRDLQ